MCKNLIYGGFTMPPSGDSVATRWDMGGTEYKRSREYNDVWWEWSNGRRKESPVLVGRDDKLKQTLQKHERSFHIDCREFEIWNWQCDGKGKIESTLKAWGFRRNPIQMEFRHNRQAPIQTHGHETQRNKLEHFKSNRLFKRWFCLFIIHAWWQGDIFNNPKQLSTQDLPYDRSLLP